jgi:PAS domain S-box-containing protein
VAGPEEAPKPGSALLAEHRRLILELEIHQTELESQNAELRETQHLLEESRSLYADLYDFAPVAYCTISEAGNIEQINLAGAAMLGTERAQLVGAPFALSLDPEERSAFREHLRICLQAPGERPRTLQLKVSERSLRMLTSSFRQAGLSHCRMAMLDITEELRAEEASKTALRMREDFLAIVSHDLRNPLNAIVISAELLLRTAPVEERRKFGRRQVETIQRASERMNRLLSDLLDLSSMDAGKLSMQPDAHDAAGLVEAALSVASPTATAKGIDLRAGEVVPGLLAYCDRERTLQVLFNLIGNAIKFTEPGGKITVSVDAGKKELSFSVKDSGIGLRPEQHEQIFTPYWKADRLSKRGTGLGLSIARGIAASQGGKLWVESKLGEGCTFFFTVPRYASPTAVTEPELPVSALVLDPAAVASEGGREELILIVDDEVDARDALAALLRLDGYRVLTAANGREALSAAKSSLPSIILLDLVMPVMDGWQFLEVRREDPELAQVPVILISGQTTAQATAQALGLAGAIDKPIRIVQLRQALERSRSRLRPQS